MSARHYGGWSDYADSVVDVFVAGQTVTLGREGLLAGGEWSVEPPAYVVTAYNPGHAAPQAANEEAQARLHDFLEASHLAWLPAVGRSRDHTWAEPSMALTGLSESEAIAIGRRFNQDAIFKWDGCALIVLPCDESAD
ncbi:MAG: hypothetical protein NVSMB48_04950 [Marmoricola sp.]